MKILFGYKNAADKVSSPVAAIGIFDGVHLGHRRIINKLRSYRGAPGDRMVITFDPHPQTVLRPDKTPPRIMSLGHRLSVLEKMGMDAALVIKFTEHIAMMSPEDFVRSVLVPVGIRRVYVGSNFHFGRARSGNTGTLREIGARYGIDVRVVAPVKHGRDVISSTWLRKLIRSGELAKAAKLLRRPVSLLGTVVKGARRGRDLGSPTANIDPHQEVIPPPGVYAVKVDTGEGLYDGVINIGYRPTFYGRPPNRREEPSIEVHIIDFEADLYGRDVEVFFIERLRKEKRFDRPEALVLQIAKDISRARTVLNASKKEALRIQKYKRAAGRPWLS